MRAVLRRFAINLPPFEAAGLDWLCRRGLPEGSRPRPAARVIVDCVMKVVKLALEEDRKAGVESPAFVFKRDERRAS